MLHITNKNRTQNVFEGTDIGVGVDEYIKAQKKEKAPEADNAVFLIENEDVPFNTENEEFIKAVKKIKNSFFDTVYLYSDYYSAKKESDGNTKAVIEYLKGKKLKVFLVLDTSFDDKTVGEISKISDGIIMYQGHISTDKFNSLLLKTKKQSLSVQ